MKTLQEELFPHPEIIFKTPYPDHNNYVRKGEEWFLIDVTYNKEIDTLFILYKNVITEEKVLDKIEQPVVPIFRRKKLVKRHEEYIPHSEVIREMVSYKNKSEEIKNLIFEPTFQSYFDKKIQQWKKLLKFKDVPYRGELLHPSIYMADVPIEELVYMQYTLSRYKPHELGISFEQVEYPKDIHYGAFDIETSELEKDGIRKINLITYVDRKRNECYALYYIDFDKYKNQERVYNEPDNLISDMKDIFNEHIMKCTDFKIREIIENTFNSLTFILKSFDTEKNMLDYFSKLVFNKCNPDVLAAFNASFDITHVYNRGVELGLPIGFWNKHGLGYEHIKPTSETTRMIDKLTNKPNLKPEGYFGYSRKPTMCQVNYANMSHTMCIDSRHLYFGIRKASTFSSTSLDSVIQNELGLNKFDYSHVTDHVTKLPYVDFYTHVQYGIMDSVLMVILENKIHDLETMFVTLIGNKINLPYFTVSNRSIVRNFHTDSFASGYIPGNNINKVLKNTTNTELEAFNKLLNIDFLNIKKHIFDGRKPAGGIVSKPKQFLTKFTKYFSKFNILNNEAILTNFLVAMYVAYLDMKSWYPYIMIARNLAKQTVYGVIDTIYYDGVAKYTRNYNFKEFKTIKQYVDDFGKICMNIAFKEVIPFCHMTLGTPSLDQIKEYLENDKIVEQEEEILDAEIVSIPIKNKLVDTFTKVLSTLNRIKLSKTDEEGINKDNKCFYLNDGTLSYYGTYVEYKYLNKNIKELMDIDTSFDYVSRIKNELVDVSRLKNEIRIDDEIIPQTEDELETMIDKLVNDISLDDESNTDESNTTLHIVKQDNLDAIPFKELTHDTIIKIMNSDYNTNEIIFDDIKVLMIERNLYFPFKQYMKTCEHLLEIDRLEREENIKDLTKYKNKFLKEVSIIDCKYRTLRKEFTSVIEISYILKLEDLELEITQQFHVINI